MNKDAIKLLVLFILLIFISSLKDIYTLTFILLASLSISYATRTLKVSLILTAPFALVYLLSYILTSDFPLIYGFASALRVVDLSLVSFSLLKHINIPRALSPSRKLSFLVVNVLVQFRNTIELKEDLELAYRSRVVGSLRWRDELKRVHVWLAVLFCKLEEKARESEDGIKSRWFHL